MSKFRIHVVGLPHTSVTLDFTACAFTERVRKFASFMHDINGHEVFLYAGPESDAECTEHIPCITEPERAAAVGDRHFVHASFDWTLPHWRRFNFTAATAIRERMRGGPNEIIAVIGGLAHQPIADEVRELPLWEFSIGYGGVIPRSLKTFESHSWRQACAGAAFGNPNAIELNWMDTVIPGSFDPADFPFRAEKDDYYLFLGRVTERKGYRVAIDACKRLGKRLIIAGQADEIPPDCEYVGVVGPEERGRLLAGAKALLALTTYSEPFGNVSPEAQLCGTPVIATNFGAFTEHIEDGKTGFLVHTMKEIADAMECAGDLDPHYIRTRAIEKYSVASVARMYERHLERLAQLWTPEGWGWLPDR